MNKQALLKRGFVDTSWIDEDETFTEYQLVRGDITITIMGIDTVELSQNSQYLTVPNCRTIKQLDQLLHLFDLR